MYYSAVLSLHFTIALTGSTPEEQYESVRAHRCLLGQSSEPASRRQNILDFSKLNLKALEKMRPLQLSPDRNPSAGYDPNEGYEPYWKGGEWTLNKDYIKQTLMKIDPEAAHDGYCGNKCSDMFKMYGKVCGKDKEDVYKTYDDYCKLLAEDCDKEKKLMLVHRGECALTTISYNLEARIQHKTHADLVEEFYNKFKRGIGSAVSQTQPWKPNTYYDDNRRRYFTKIY